jgi:hypothetical protein
VLLILVLNRLFTPPLVGVLDPTAGNVREHILGMIDFRDKLKDLDCPLNDATLLHHVMLSLSRGGEATLSEPRFCQRR